MSVSLQFLERCSADTGFSVATLEKVVRLGELAADVARHPTLEALTAEAWRVVGPFLALEPSEREFVEAIQIGQFRHELLGPGVSAACRELEHHPAVQWKLRNAQAHAARGGRVTRGRRDRSDKGP